MVRRMSHGTRGFARRSRRHCADYAKTHASTFMAGSPQTAEPTALGTHQIAVARNTKGLCQRARTKLYPRELPCRRGARRRYSTPAWGRGS